MQEIILELLRKLNLPEEAIHAFTSSGHSIACSIFNQIIKDPVSHGIFVQVFKDFQ